MIYLSELFQMVAPDKGAAVVRSAGCRQLLRQRPRGTGAVALSAAAQMMSATTSGIERGDLSGRGHDD